MSNDSMTERADNPGNGSAPSTEADMEQNENEAQHDNVVTHDDLGLPLTDRCDRCGAHAHVMATFPSGSTLLFCGHHANEGWIALTTVTGVRVDDYRPFLHAQERALVHPSVKS